MTRSQSTYICFTLILVLLTLPIKANVRLQTQQLDEVIGLLELKKPYADRELWLKNAASLHRIIQKNKLTDQQFAVALNQLLASSGIYSPAVFSTDSFPYLQMLHPEKSHLWGYIAKLHGSASYIQYVLNAGSTLQRGDRLEKPPSLPKPKGSISLIIKKSPLKANQVLSTPQDHRSLREAFFDFSYRSIGTFTAQNQQHPYIHLLDCGSSSLPLIKTWIGKAKKTAHFFLDLRDCYCEDSTAITATIHKQLPQSKIVILQNKGTRLGAEHLIQSIKSSWRENSVSIGEPTGGFSSPRQALKLSMGDLWLLIPEHKQTVAPLAPDFFTKDSFIYAQGQDDLLNAAQAYVFSKKSH